MPPRHDLSAPRVEAQLRLDGRGGVSGGGVDEEGCAGSDVLRADGGEDGDGIGEHRGAGGRGDSADGLGGVVGEVDRRSGEGLRIDRGSVGGVDLEGDDGLLGLAE